MMHYEVNIANLLSGFRLIAAPFLLCFSWTGRRDLFLILLAISLVTDSIDGFIARRLRASSAFGTKLDSWGDLATYVTVPLCSYWLWPDIVKRESLFVLFVIAAFIFPLIAGYLKFRKLPTYHTWAAKTSAVLISGSAFILFLADIAWPFRIAAIFQFVVACEEIAITILLSELQSNVRSAWHVRKHLQHKSKESNERR